MLSSVLATPRASSWPDKPISVGPIWDAPRPYRALKAVCSAVFDELVGELSLALDHFKVPAREKGEVLDAFAGEKGEVTAGSEPGAVNWRRWR